MTIPLLVLFACPTSRCNSPIPISNRYTDLQPPGSCRYGNAHYSKWLFPLCGAGFWFWLLSFGVWRVMNR